MWSGQLDRSFLDELPTLVGRTRAADPVRAAAMRSQAALLSLTIGDQNLGLAAASEAAADVAGLPPRPGADAEASSTEKKKNCGRLVPPSRARLHDLPFLELNAKLARRCAA